MINLLFKNRYLEIIVGITLAIIFAFNHYNLFYIFLGSIFFINISLVNLNSISYENRGHISWMTLMITFSELSHTFSMKVLFLGLVPFSLIFRFIREREFKTFQVIFLSDLMCFFATSCLFYFGLLDVGFNFLLLSVVIRTFQFPFNYWIKKSGYVTDIYPSLLYLLTGQTGLLLFSKVTVLTHVNENLILFVTCLTLFTGLLTSIGAMRNSDFLLKHFLLIVSQSCLPLAAFYSKDTTTATGGVLFGLTIGLGGTISGIILYQVFLQKNIRLLDKYYSLYRSNKNMALFYLISAMSFVGMPFTIGYISEDILFHGLVTNHPIFASVYILMTALNAFTIFKIFNSLFFGHSMIKTTEIYFSKLNKIIIGSAISFIVLAGFFAGPLAKFVEENISLIFIN